MTSYSASAPYTEATARYAGFWARVGAALVDTVLLGVVTSAIGFAMGLSFATVGLRPSLSWGISNLVGGLIVLAYFSLLESSARQATLGKMALGLRVTDTAGGRISLGRAVLRHISKLVSTLILGIGFLMVAFTARKQGLHDMMAGTLVVRQ